MSETQTPSPEQTGTSQSPSQPAGTEISGVGESTPVEGRPDSYTSLTLDQALEKLKASDRDRGASKQEALRLKQALDEKEQRIAQYEYLIQVAQQQAQQQPVKPAREEIVTTQPSGGNLLSDEEAQAFLDAQISGNVREYQRLENLKADRLLNRQREQRASEEQAVQQEQSTLAMLQRAGVNDLAQNPALAQKILQKYDQLESDNVTKNAYAGVRTTKLKLGLREFHPMILRDAIWEARVELANSQGAAQAASRQSSEHFIEPSNRASTSALNPEPVNKGFDPAKHLFDWEQGACGAGKLYKDFETYWKHLHPDLQKARLSRGMPIKAAEIGMMEIRYR